MLIKNEKLKIPPWNATLWRYMSFEKFLDIIHNQSLHFTNVSLLLDQREAEIPSRNFDKYLSSIPIGIDKMSNESIEFVKFYGDLLARRKASFVNCWVLSPDESYALWKIYLSGNKAGVAIKTRTKNLIDAINAKSKPDGQPKIHMGKVEYTDFIKKEVSIESLITTKSKAYKYENECRLVILNEPEYDYTTDGREQKLHNFFKVDVDIDKLINEVYISPFGGAMFYDVFVSTLKKLSPSLLSRIRESSIIEK